MKPVADLACFTALLNKCLFSYIEIYEKYGIITSVN